MAVTETLKKLYFDQVRSIEIASSFSAFHPEAAPLTESDFDRNATVLLIGPYSTGKTSFVSYFIDRAPYADGTPYVYPTGAIRPDPSTDCFVIIKHGETEGNITQGNVLTLLKSSPFTSAAKFGKEFLDRLKSVDVPAEKLKSLTIIDTPGVLAESFHRGYDFIEVMRWFSTQVDMVLLFFDQSSLDISPELKNLISQAIEGQENKFRVILNKADLPFEDLLKVYGGLTWSLGKIFTKMHECKRVYITSFKRTPFEHKETQPILEKEQEAVIKELLNLSENTPLRKVDLVVQRVRQLKIHLHILVHFKKSMPYLWGHDDIKKNLLENLPTLFTNLANQLNVPKHDFPKVDQFRQVAEKMDWTAVLANVDVTKLATINSILANDLPVLTQRATTTVPLPSKL